MVNSIRRNKNRPALNTIGRLKENIMYDREFSQKDKEQYHIDRTATHIGIVQFLVTRFRDTIWEDALLSEEYGNAADHAMFSAEHHDEDKLTGDIFEQYVDIDWMYYCKKNGIPVPEYTQELDDATYQHVTTNDHHPAFWDENYTPVEVTDFVDRDTMEREEMINATKMPLSSIIEMVADWTAVGFERGNTAIDWFENNVLVSTAFTEQQVDWIYECLEIMQEVIDNMEESDVFAENMAGDTVALRENSSGAMPTDFTKAFRHSIEADPDCSRMCLTSKRVDAFMHREPPDFAMKVEDAIKRTIMTFISRGNLDYEKHLCPALSKILEVKPDAFVQYTEFQDAVEEQVKITNHTSSTNSTSGESQDDN